MTKAQIAAVEKALGLKVPPHYRAFLLNFPPGLHKPNAKDGKQWQWLGADHGLFHTVRSFVEYNRSVRGLAYYS